MVVTTLMHALEAPSQRRMSHQKRIAPFIGTSPPDNASHRGIQPSLTDKRASSLVEVPLNQCFSLY